ncbi:MAG: hypothetical protein WC856_05610 [Methylococcaceae bacterium]|jgi:hypothetical protein
MKFPSSFQRFMQRFHTRILSFGAFKRIASVAACFGLIWLVSSWGVLSNTITPFATFGTIIFAVIASAELLFQCVEHTAARLSHESNYYWASLILLAVLIANVRDDLSRYIVLFSFVMLARWLIAGLAQALSGTR